MAKAKCIACGEELIEGVLVLPDMDGGYIHRLCCGPEPESFVQFGPDGDDRPLEPGEVLPPGYPYDPDPHEDDDEEDTPTVH